MGQKFKICVEVMDNGYSVEIPDIDAYDAAKKKAEKNKSPSGYVSSPYMGDFMKEYIAKTVPEVIALLTPALKNLPQTTYDEAFAEATAADD